MCVFTRSWAVSLAWAQGVSLGAGREERALKRSCVAGLVVLFQRVPRMPSNALRGQKRKKKEKALYILVTIPWMNHDIYSGLLQNYCSVLVHFQSPASSGRTLISGHDCTSVEVVWTCLIGNLFLESLLLYTPTSTLSTSTLST